MVEANDSPAQQGSNRSRMLRRSGWTYCLPNVRDNRARLNFNSPGAPNSLSPGGNSGYSSPSSSLSNESFRSNASTSDESSFNSPRPGYGQSPSMYSSPEEDTRGRRMPNFYYSDADADEEARRVPRS